MAASALPVRLFASARLALALLALTVATLLTSVSALVAQLPRGKYARYDNQYIATGQQSFSMYILLPHAYDASIQRTGTFKLTLATPGSFSATSTCSMVYDTGHEAILTYDNGGSNLPLMIAFSMAVPIEVPPSAPFVVKCFAEWRTTFESTSISSISATYEFFFTSGLAYTTSTLNAAVEEVLSGDFGVNVFDYTPAFLNTDVGVVGNIESSTSTNNMVALYVANQQEKLYRGGPGTYCTVEGTPNEANPAGFAVSVAPLPEEESLFYVGACKFPFHTLTFHGDNLQGPFVLRVSIYMPNAPTTITAFATTNTVTRLITISGSAGVTIKPLSRFSSNSSRPYAVTAFARLGEYTPQRRFSATLPGGSVIGANLDWYSFQPRASLTPDAARRYSRPRPRYLQAQATAAAAAPSLGALNYSTAGQHVFWFGGIAVTDEGFIGDTDAAVPLLADLWMVDVLGNTTTLLSGDPARTDEPAQLPSSTYTLVTGEYHARVRPAARHSAALAYDASTRTVWLYGGALKPLTSAFALTQKLFSDMWSFSLDRMQWAWWLGTTTPQARPTSSTVFGSCPPLAGASMVAHDGSLYLYGGATLASTVHSVVYSMYYEMDHVWRYNTTDRGATLLYGSTGYIGYGTIDNTVPPQATATTPGSAAYASLTANPREDGTLVLYIFGGVLSPTPRFGSMIGGGYNAAPSHSDSSVLATLWSFTPGLTPSLSLWTRLSVPPVATGGNRGIPRLVMPTQQDVPVHPGGRVFAGVNAAPNGDVYVYGGRGHAAGFLVRRTAAKDSPLSLINVEPVSPFTFPLAGRFTGVTEIDATSTHAFIYTRAEFLAAGWDLKTPLSQMDIMLPSSINNVQSPFYSSDKFIVYAALVPTTLSAFNSTHDSNYVKSTIANLAMANAVPVTFEGLRWMNGGYFTLNNAKADKMPLLLPRSTENIMLVMRVIYDSAMSSTAQTVPTFALEMESCDAEVSISFLSDAVAVSPVLDTFKRYNQRPAMLLRSNLPSMPWTIPLMSRSAHAVAQLDDLWVYRVSTSAWEMIQAYGGPVQRTEDSNLIESPRASPFSSFSKHWPGARLQPALLLPTMHETFGGATNADITVFIYGGYSLRPTEADDRSALLSPTLDRWPNHYKIFTVHDDLWSIDLAAECIDSTAPGASFCAPAATFGSSSSLNPFVSTWHSSLYKAQYFNTLHESGNTCSIESALSCGSGMCVGGGGGYFCNCDDYADQVTLTCKEGSSFKKALLTPMQGWTTFDYLEHFNPFSAVAMHPVSKEIYTYGGLSLQGTANAFVSGKLAKINLATQIRTLISFVRPTNGVDQHEVTQNLVPSASGTAVTFGDTMPPASFESHAWFSPSGHTMFLFADSFFTEPGVWAYNVSANTWLRATAVTTTYPVGDYGSLWGSPGDYNSTYHPSARQGFAKASFEGLFCLYSGKQVVFNNALAGINTDLWCLKTVEGPISPEWAIMAGGTEMPSVSTYRPVAGAYGEFDASFNPGPRLGASMTFSADGQFLYLFGGNLYGDSSLPSVALMSDLWVFSMSTRMWALLAGPIEHAVPGSTYERSHYAVNGSPSPLQYPGARMHAAMHMTDEGLLYIGFGLESANSETGYSEVSKDLFAIFAPQLHVSGWTPSSKYDFAPTHTVGSPDAAWIWLSDNNGGIETPLEFRWNTNGQGRRMGAQFLMLPSSLGSADGSFIQKSGVLLHSTSAIYSFVALPMETKYPFFSFNSFTTETQGFMAITSACRVNPCANNGECRVCSGISGACSPNEMNSVGITSSFYKCVCPAGFYGKHCEVTISTYIPPSAVSKIECPTGSPPSSMLLVPCNCAQGTAGPLCSPHVTVAIMSSDATNNGLPGRVFSATTRAHNISGELPLLLGAQSGSSVLFMSGGYTDTSSEQMSASIMAWLVDSRTTVMLHTEPKPIGTGAAVFSGAKTTPGRHYGASLVYAPGANMLFLFGGVVTVDASTRGIFERLWRIVPGEENLSPLPVILSPSANYLVASRGYELLSPESVISDGLHSYRLTDDHPLGYPGARAFHAAAVVNLNGVEWMYVYGGAGKLTGNSVGYRADLWRYRIDGTNPNFTWEYVACSLAYGYDVTAHPASTFVAYAAAYNCPVARARAQLVAVGTKLWLTGGLGTKGPLDDVWVFDAIEESWTLVSGEPNRADAANTLSHNRPNLDATSISDRKIGSRYDHSCDILPGTTEMYCQGGMTAQGMTADFFRSTQPVQLSQAEHHPSIMSTSVYVPFHPQVLGLESRIATFVSVSDLNMAGLMPNMGISTFSFYFARPVDTNLPFSFSLTISLRFVTS